MKYTLADKYHAMMRAYERLRIISTDNGSGIDNCSPKDLAEAFFNQSYHLKDWIKRETKRNDVEAYIQKSEPLRIAADLCNSMKHAGLDRPPRSGEHLSAVLVHMNIDIDRYGAQASAQVEIRLGPNSYNAFRLAADCVAAWDRYLSVAGIVIPDP